LSVARAESSGAARGRDALLSGVLLPLSSHTRRGVSPAVREFADDSGSRTRGMSVASARRAPVATSIARRTILALLAAVLASGCATSTRSGALGALARGEHLVTLVVTEDRMVVRAECLPYFTDPYLLGCQLSRAVELGEGRSVRVVRIVRYTDRVPSALAFEIDIHELCHAVAALQPIDDPCHVGNEGVVERAAVPRHLLVR
jgi:hypothetical protein